MNKKGFTLVELLATIVILATVIALGVGCIQIVSTRIRNSNYESKKDLIEIKAAEYANDTGYLFTNVDNLIKMGYLSADDQKGNYLNPITNKPMNCYVVQIRNENDNLYGELTEEQECNPNDILKTNVHLGIQILKSSDRTQVENDTWVGEDIFLEVYFKDGNSKEEDVEKIIWKTNFFTEERIVNNDFRNKNTYFVEASQILNSPFFVEVILKDKTTYYAKTNVKIDKQNPVIFKDDIQVVFLNPNTRSSSTLKTVITDAYGSGIAGYYVGENPNCQDVTYVDRTENYIEVPIMNSVYYICIKDKVGNISEKNSTVKVDLVNYVPPQIKAIKSNLILQKEDYDFKNNIEVDFGIFNGFVSCNPTISKKMGSYDVTCTASCENGLSASTTFHVQHS